MADIGDTTSLLEVCFGLNLAAPALFGIADRTRANVTRSVAEAAMRFDKDLRVSDGDRKNLEKYVVSYFPALKFLFLVTRALVILSLIVSGLCVGGLLLAAISPTVKVSEYTVIGGTLIAITLPLLYVALRSFLGWAERTLVHQLENNSRVESFSGEYFCSFIKRQQEWNEGMKAFDEVMQKMPIVKRTRP